MTRVRHTGRPIAARRVVAALGLLVVLPGIVGCGDDGGRADAAPPLEAEVTRGPITLRQRLEPGDPRVGDVIVMTLRIEAPDGVRIGVPSLGEEVGPFAILDLDAPPDAPIEGGRGRTIAIDLQSFAAGDLTVPAIAVPFTDARPAVETDGAAGGRDDPIEGTLETEPVEIRIRSVAGEDASEADAFAVDADLRSVPAPPEEGRGRSWRRPLLAALAGLTLLALAIVVSRRIHRPRVRVEPPPPLPWAWARAELAALRASGMLEAADLQPFYVRLSDVVRGYLERRFGLMAPERTTDEFLRELADGGPLRREHADLVASFLRAADLVKFARHRPEPGDARSALDAAARLVEETVPAEHAGTAGQAGKGRP